MELPLLLDEDSSPTVDEDSLFGAIEGLPVDEDSLFAAIVLPVVVVETFPRLPAQSLLDEDEASTPGMNKALPPLSDVLADSPPGGAVSDEDSPS